MKGVLSGIMLSALFFSNIYAEVKVKVMECLYEGSSKDFIIVSQMVDDHCQRKLNFWGNPIPACDKKVITLKDGESIQDYIAGLPDYMEPFVIKNVDGTYELFVKA